MYPALFSLQEEVFRTIASQKRLEIIQLLHDRELTVTQMTDMLGLRQANISQHLSELRRAKIVIARRDGTKVYYRLGDARIAEACMLIKLFLLDQYAIDPEMQKLMQDGKSLFPVVIDPVCGMRISVAHAGDTLEHAGTTYYFCASGCRQQFELQPDSYRGSPASSTAQSQNTPQ